MHHLAAMARRVIGGQPLLKAEMSIGQRRDHHLTAFDRNAHPLIDVEMCFTRDCCGQTHPRDYCPIV